MLAVSQFNPFAPETIECPFPFYAAMRTEVIVYQLPGMDFFIVNTHEDIKKIARDTETFSSKTGPGVRTEPPQEVVEILKPGWLPVATLLTNDPPAHRRYRSLGNKTFTPRLVAQQVPSIRAVANDLIDRFIEAGGVELFEHFAVPVPLTVIADTAGVSRTNLPDFKRWSDDAAAPLGGMISIEQEIACAHSTVEF